MGSLKTFLNNLTVYLNDIIIDTSRLEIKNVETITQNKFQTKFQDSVNHLFIDGIKVKNSDKLKFEYKCLTCGEINKISSYKRFKSKINNLNFQYCVHCFQKYDVNNMNELRKISLTGKKKSEVKFAKEKPVKNKVDFNDLSDEEKSYYWEKHYTVDEWKSFVKDFNVKFVNDINVNEIEYIPYFPSNNQNKFSSKIKYNDQVFGIMSVKCQCKICGNIFKFHWEKHNIKSKKTENICRDCGRTEYFSNRTWRTKSCNNINNDKILYQSNYEKMFIDFCNENNVLIINGPKLEYFFNNKNRHYYVDFYVPKLNWIIELKDEHPFHINDVNSGKFQAKNSIAEKFVENGTFNKFLILFKKDFSETWKEEFIKNYNKI